MELARVQQRQETVSITPQLDLERYQARVSLHFRVSPRAPPCSRCAYPPAHVRVNTRARAHVHTGDERVTEPRRERIRHCFTGGSEIQQRERISERERERERETETESKRLVALSATVIPRREPVLQASHNRIRSSTRFRKRDVENGQLLANVRSDSRRNIDSRVPRSSMIVGRVAIMFASANYWNAISGD